MIKRINFFGGPGSGKSTTAAWLYSELKTRGLSIELVTEYVKIWAIRKEKPEVFDQILFLGEQMHSEYRFLKHGVERIVTDSPVFLSGLYASFYDTENRFRLQKSILDIAFEYEAQFPSLNIFLNRKDREYKQEGRYQSLEEAIEIDTYIRNFLWDNADRLNVQFIDYNNRPNILTTVIQHL